MNRTKQVLLAAFVSLALAFTFSCSSGGGDGTGCVGSKCSDDDDGKVGGGDDDDNGNGPGGDGKDDGGKDDADGVCPKGVTVNAREGVNGSVTCGGKTYETVKIGTQTWMKKNLDYEAVGSKCYNNLEDNCDTYGRLYDWATAKTVCPKGWHLPSSAEWTTLTDYVESPSRSNCIVCAGTRLKASTGWTAYSGVPAGTDDYGFSALPGGYGDSDGLFGLVVVPRRT